MSHIPSELAIGGVFLPPGLIAGTIGVLAAYLAAAVLNHYRLSRHFFYPPLVFVALAIVFTAVVGALVIPF